MATDKPRRAVRRQKVQPIDTEKLVRDALEESERISAEEQAQADEARAVREAANGELRIAPDGSVVESPVPLGLPDGHDFPTWVLPPAIRDFVDAISASHEVPIDLPSMLSLGALATAIQGKWVCEPRPGWREPLNLYLACAMEPGEQKSSAFKAVFAPLWAHERKMIETWKKAVTPLEIQATMKKRGEPKPNIPVRPRIFVDDATQEMVALILSQQGERLAIASDEGTIFSLICGLYNKTPNNGVFLKSHDGGSYTVDRRDLEKHVRLGNPLITMALAIQPEIMRMLATKPELRGQGMIARFLFSVPKSNIGRKTFDGPPVPWHVRDSYTHLFEHLLNAAPADWSAPSDVHPKGYRGKPGVLRFSLAAWEQMRDVCVALDRRMADGEDLQHIQDWASKFRGAIVRIAGLLHVVRCLSEGVAPESQKIELNDLLASLTIGHFLLLQAFRAFALMESESSNKDAQALLKWIEKGKFLYVTKRQIQHGSHMRKSSRIAAALGLLVENGHLEQVARVAGSRVGGYKVIKGPDSCDPATQGGSDDE